MDINIIRNTLSGISYGLYAITTHNKNKTNGMILNTVMQITSNPARVVVCINKNNLTCDYILENNTFAVSILEENTPVDFIGNLGFKSGRDTDKLLNISCKTGQTGNPIIIDNTVSFFEGKVFNTVDVGTHILFSADIVNAENLTSTKPLTYSYYKEIKKGKVSVNAPTYIEQDISAQKENGGEMYICNVCGYVYDSTKGDPQNGIAPNTLFKDLPENWVCPVCGAPKTSFAPKNA